MPGPGRHCRWRCPHAVEPKDRRARNAWPTLGSLLSANLAHHGRIARVLHVFDDLGNPVIFTTRARIDEQLRQQTEDNKLDAGEQEKDAHQKEGSVANPPSPQPTESEF